MLLKHSKMKVLMFIIMFLLIGAFFIISNENIRLNSRENADLFFKSYAEWMNSLISNGGAVVGYVVKMEWLPDK